jgi:hypothetical protein
MGDTDLLNLWTLGDEILEGVTLSFFLFWCFTFAGCWDLQWFPTIIHA